LRIDEVALMTVRPGTAVAKFDDERGILRPLVR
jgi:hypothetical protein